MNPQLNKTEYLATGQTAPFTGEWVNTARCRNGFIVVYSSGSTVDIDLQAKTQLYGQTIFEKGGSADSVSFYTETGVGPGYASPIFFDSPISEIRLAIPTGTAPVFAYVNYQN